MTFLVGAKVWDSSHKMCCSLRFTNFLQIFNVQVPFYFKNIVDAMNIDVAAVGGTAWTIAGTMVLACEYHYALFTFFS